MKILKLKINNIALCIIAAIICILYTTYYVLQPVSMIDKEKKDQFGRAEIFVKGIDRPQSLVLDKKGKLFTQSAVDGKISIIDKDGTALDYIYVQDYYGYGMELDANGNFLLAAGKQLIGIDISGKVVRRVTGFERIYDVENGPNNTLFVSDSITNTIYCISPDNEVTVFAELEGTKSYSVPNATGISFDKEYKNLYVLNMYRGELYKIEVSEDNKAESIEVWASNLQRPNYIDVDNQGNAYITCIGDNTVVRINRNGIKEVIDTKGKLATPSGIVVNDSGFNNVLYIASRNSNSIYRVLIYSDNEKRNE